MGSRNRSGLFTPDERGLGGAMQIADSYRHFWESRRLSHQRQAKHATSNTVAQDHQTRLGHMYGRIAAPTSSRTQQQQQTWSPEHRPRPGSSVAADISLWLPRRHASPQTRRPSTAPEQRSSRGASGSDSAGRQLDWQLLKAAAHPQPQPPLSPVQLPPSRYYMGPSLLPSVQHRLHKATLMQDILTRQLYRAADIRGLCAAFVHSQPPEHRDSLRKVAAEVLHELEVPFTNELDTCTT